MHEFDWDLHVQCLEQDPNTILTIQRSKNENVVVYSEEQGEMNVYWRLAKEDLLRTCPLTFFENLYYGVTKETDTLAIRGLNHIRLTLVTRGTTRFVGMVNPYNHEEHWRLHAVYILSEGWNVISLDLYIQTSRSGPIEIRRFTPEELS